MLEVFGFVFFGVWLLFIIYCGVIGGGGRTLLGLSEDAFVLFVLGQLLLMLVMIVVFARKVVFAKKNHRSEDHDLFD